MSKKRTSRQLLTRCIYLHGGVTLLNWTASTFSFVAASANYAQGGMILPAINYTAACVCLNLAINEWRKFKDLWDIRRELDKFFEEYIVG